MALLLPVCLLSQDVKTGTKISRLLQTMTVEEKVGQMAQVAVDEIGSVDPVTKIFSIDSAKLYDVLVRHKIGSILNTPSNALLNVSQWNNLINAIQDAAKKTRLSIPVIYGLDDIHGVNFVDGFTSFPQQIAQAATWNRQLANNCGIITAYESRALGVPWSFSPVMDLGTNPTWPRLWETYGEDPFLSGEMGSSFIKGMQAPLGSKEKIAVSIKHFMGYSDPKYGKDRTNAWIPEPYLREYHLPSFAAAIKAGARTVMVNSALINGVPSHMNKHLLTGILKGELGFTGFVVTDWQDVENIRKRDKIAKDNKEALMFCINAGIDMSMIPHNYKEFCNDLINLVKEGRVSMNRIDDAVSRILRVKYELGLFGTPITVAAQYPKFGSEEFSQAAYNTAAESITLLKNKKNILPISRNAKLLVTGPNANTMRPLNGGWTYTWQGDKTDEHASRYNTILEAASKKWGGQHVYFSEGVAYKMKGKYWEDSIVNIDEVVRAAGAVDYILLCIGENSYTETPGNTSDLNLSENQLLLANAVLKTGKPVIVVLNEGRPRIISKIETGSSAILHTYLPGNYGADALVDILDGTVNPSGKLPYTYPRYTNALTPYIHKPSDYIANPQGEYDYTADFDPLFEFGSGLSYTSFEYSDLKIDKQSVTPNDIVTITVSIKNTGNREGKQVVQLFVSDLLASITPDTKRLRGFDKINLKPGEMGTVQFRLPIKELAFVNVDNKKQLEKGDFKVEIGTLSAILNLTEAKVF